MTKTNAMRLLDAARIPYRTLEYEYSEDLSGAHAAEVTGFPADQMFKTLVAKSADSVLVFCVPVLMELDLKKAAAVSGSKKVDMLHMKDLLPVTGYVRGGCSPVGMKKKYPTFIDETALLWDEISVSAGARGQQLILSPDALGKFIGAQFVELTQ